MARLRVSVDDRRQDTPLGLRDVTWDPGEGLAEVTFRVRPLSLLERLEVAQREAVGPPDRAGLAGRMIDMLVDAVRSWDGLDGPDDQPLPCTEEAKRAVFRRLDGAREAVFWALMGRADPNRKNASGAGSDSGSPAPESSAGSESAPTDPPTGATPSPG